MKNLFVVLLSFAMSPKFPAQTVRWKRRLNFVVRGCYANANGRVGSTMSTVSEKATADLSPSAAMIHLMMGLWVSRAIYVTAKQGIADLLKNNSKTVEELAEA